MKCDLPGLLTPVYVKLDPAMPWPEAEPVFFLLTRDGLFLCRNTPFFRSCVPARRFPEDLAPQALFLHVRYPRIPRRLIELTVGFFELIGHQHASEAIVLLVWNRTTQSVELVVPDQTGYVATGWNGQRYPVDLEYQIPPLPTDCCLIGDIHSHVDGPAYASYTDQFDESHRPGLHLVVGRVFDPVPQFHAETIADGHRFRIDDLSLIIEGYHASLAAEVPAEWLDRVVVKPSAAKPHY